MGHHAGRSSEALDRLAVEGDELGLVFDPGKPQRREGLRFGIEMREIRADSRPDAGDVALAGAPIETEFRKVGGVHRAENRVHEEGVERNAFRAVPRHGARYVERNGHRESAGDGFRKGAEVFGTRKALEVERLEEGAGGGSGGHEGLRLKRIRKPQVYRRQD